MGLPHQRNTFPQCRSDIVIQQEGLAAQGVDSKEIRSTVNIDAPVTRHTGIIFDRRVIRALRLLLHPTQVQQSRLGVTQYIGIHIFYLPRNQPRFVFKISNQSIELMTP